MKWPFSQDGAGNPGMRITISSDRAFDSQTAVLGSDGAFEFSGLAKGGYAIFASVRGYRLTSGQYGSMALELDRDVSDFVMKLDPQ